MAEMSAVKEALTTFDITPYDKMLIAQDQLDLVSKSRTSLFPWRGQFSPELIELFLSTFANTGDVVLDPFAGSGTVLFEAARKGLKSYAAEINPSAVDMASTAHFVNVHPKDRVQFIRKAETLTHGLVTSNQLNLWSQQPLGNAGELESVETQVGRLIRELTDDPLTRNIIANALIRYMNYRKPVPSKDFPRALREHAAIIRELPFSDQPVELFHTDARTIPLPDNSVNLVITSPPYINVFNYHQNNRPAMELMGWDLLRIAHSEFGSNRKNRQNRFLTVVQYCLDMLDILLELRRLLTSNGRAIIVVGRESNVRGVNFMNGRIVSALATGGAGFKLELLQERVFTNRFGESIYEDILHLVPLPGTQLLGAEFSRALAQTVLAEGSEIAEGDIKREVLEARSKAPQVQKSPIFVLPTLEPSGEEVTATKVRKGRKSTKEAHNHFSVDPTPREAQGVAGQLQATPGRQAES